MLYQLSYLGILGRPKGLGERAVYREVGGLCPPGFAFGFAGRGPRFADAGFTHPQIIGKTRLFGVFGVRLAAGDDVFAG